MTYHNVWAFPVSRYTLHATLTYVGFTVGASVSRCAGAGSPNGINLYTAAAVVTLLGFTDILSYLASGSGRFEVSGWMYAMTMEAWRW